jgi:hypothetical protein
MLLHVFSVGDSYVDTYVRWNGCSGKHENSLFARLVSLRMQTKQ